MVNQKNTDRKKIIVLLDDLFFSSKIREAAKHLEIELEFVKEPSSFTDQMRLGNPALVLVDLNSKAFSPLQVIKTIKSTGELKQIPVLGYLSHVQTELKKEAAKAGCDLILPRSKFSRDLKNILRNYLE